LTTEERQRIEDEERKRMAEEEYRAEIRAKLQGAAAPVKKSTSRMIPWILGVGAALVIGMIVLTNSRSQSRIGDDSGTAAPAALNSTPAAEPPAPAAEPPAPVPKTRHIPVSQKIATGQIVVRANGYVQYRITITPEMVAPTVTGTFSASGGTGNDIQAVIVDEENYSNWINGHQAQAFWTTQGKQTTGNIEAQLNPGMYYLAFSNKFSAFTAKQVFLEVDLNYKKAETYY
jgi:hypothetical protein